MAASPLTPDAWQTSRTRRPARAASSRGEDPPTKPISRRGGRAGPSGCRAKPDAAPRARARGRPEAAIGAGWRVPPRRVVPCERDGRFRRLACEHQAGTRPRPRGGGADPRGPGAAVRGPGARPDGRGALVRLGRGAGRGGGGLLRPGRAGRRGAPLAGFSKEDVADATNVVWLDLDPPPDAAADDGARWSPRPGRWLEALRALGLGAVGLRVLGPGLLGVLEARPARPAGARRRP